MQPLAAGDLDRECRQQKPARQAGRVSLSGNRGQLAGGILSVAPTAGAAAYIGVGVCNQFPLHPIAIDFLGDFQ